jgi:chromosome segregation ATPase
MRYNKEKDRPYKSGASVRDHQMRVKMTQQVEPSIGSSEAVISELRTQIANLTQELVKKSKTTGEFTADQVDEEIRKAVSHTLKETKAKYKREIEQLTNRNTELEKEVVELKDRLKAKEDNYIADLHKKMEELAMKVSTMKNVTTDGESDTEEGRPKLEEVFIDPISKDSDIESHVTIKDDKQEEKIDLDGDIDKLKKLLGGKLPGFKKLEDQ